MNNTTNPTTDLTPQTIQDKIVCLAGRPPAMLDKSLAEIYETKNDVCQSSCQA